jgi:hypothetical protein
MHVLCITARVFNFGHWQLSLTAHGGASFEAAFRLAGSGTEEDGT